MLTSGRFIGTFHAGDSAEDYNPDWLRVPMPWSGYGIEDNQLMIEAAGLRIIRAKNETTQSDVDWGPTTFHWIVAEKVQQT